MESLDLQEQEENNLINSFIQDYSEQLLEKKKIDKRIKNIKYKYEEQGISTKNAIRAFNEVRSERNKEDEDLLAKIEYYKDCLRNNRDTQKAIDMLDCEE